MEPCHWSEGRHNNVGSLQERQATTQVMLGVSLRARWDATLVSDNKTMLSILVPVDSPGMTIKRHHFSTATPKLEVSSCSSTRGWD